MCLKQDRDGFPSYNVCKTMVLLCTPENIQTVTHSYQWSYGSRTKGRKIYNSIHTNERTDGSDYGKDYVVLYLRQINKNTYVHMYITVISLFYILILSLGVTLRLMIGHFTVIVKANDM